MPDLTDTYANADGAFVFQTDEDTPQQVVNALEDFTTWLDLFNVRSREYGDGAAFTLGSKGQFSDIYRKIIKLKTALWDDKPEQLTSEGVEEVIYDLIGHLFLTLQCLRLEGFNRKFPVRGAEEITEFAQAIMETPEYKRLASFDAEQVARMNDKRKTVRKLYPQIGAGSLDARTEESLDWLISAAKPTEDAADDREWLYDKGDKVTKEKNSGGWLNGRTGTIIKRNVEDAGIWYTVDFGPEATGITCHQASLSIVSRSQAWWDEHKEKVDEVPNWQKGVELPKGSSEPTLVADVERKIVGRPIKDNPQA